VTVRGFLSLATCYAEPNGRVRPQADIRRSHANNPDSMTYFKDLDLIRYHDGPCCADAWHCPLLAIGWLEKGHDYLSGICPPQLVERLTELRSMFAVAFPAHSFRGWHTCSMCSGETKLLRDSHINLFIPGLEAIYLATGRVDHYINTHAYVPPMAFVDALMMCPDPRSAEYQAALLRLNKGH
jgi:hypothetical protein